MRNRLLSMLSVLLVIGICCGLLYAKQREARRREALEALAAAARPLEKQRDDLNVELARTVNAIETEKLTQGTVQVLLVELNEECYTQLAPIMSFPGIMGLSLTEFPGMEGKLTKGQFDSLCARDWTYCLNYNGTQPLETWLPQMKEKLTKAGIAMPETIYFWQDTYRPEMDKTLAAYGITIAMGDDFQNGAEGDITFCKSSQWNYNGVKSDLEAVSDNGTNRVLTVSFTRQENLFVEENFQRMVEYVNGFIARGTLEAGDIVAAVEDKKAVMQDEDARRTQLEEKAAALQAQIKDISAQIRAIFDNSEE